MYRKNLVLYGQILYWCRAFIACNVYAWPCHRPWLYMPAQQKSLQIWANTEICLNMKMDPSTYTVHVKEQLQCRWVQYILKLFLYSVD